MITQSYCGVFDQQADAQVAAGYFQNLGYQVTGPAQFGLAELDTMQGGVRNSLAFPSSWLVTATSNGATAKSARPVL